MRFWKNNDGAVLVYVSVIMVVLVGLVGLAIDGGRILTLRQEVQSAADAAALAGAWQLDGTQPGSLLADLAARTAPVVSNSQKFGDTSGIISVASTSFWSAVPPSDDTALTLAPPPYDYIEVTTTGVVQSPIFMRFVGGPATTTLTAKAVARKGQALCSTTPLWMCLPDPSPFQISNWVGKQVIAKSGPTGNQQWSSGNWGLLDTPNNGQGVSALIPYIASENGLPLCTSTGHLSTSTGVKNPVFTAFNVRFDMFEGQASGYINQQGYSPAENVTKGKAPNIKVTGSNTTVECDKFVNTTVDTRMGRDSSFTGNFGNGSWDCGQYWALNHPNGPSAPTGCGAVGSTTLSRYEIYSQEISSGNIPNTVANGGDNGNPICVQSPNAPKPTPTIPSQKFTDRRILTVAGVDCSDQTDPSYPYNGNTNLAKVQVYLAMFMTEAVDGNQGDLYLEFAGSSEAGGAGPVPIQLRDWVELVR